MASYPTLFGAPPQPRRADAAGPLGSAARPTPPTDAATRGAAALDSWAAPPGAAHGGPWATGAAGSAPGGWGARPDAWGPPPRLGAAAPTAPHVVASAPPTPPAAWAVALGEATAAAGSAAALRDLFAELTPAQRPALFMAAHRLQLLEAQAEPRALALRALADHVLAATGDHAEADAPAEGLASLEGAVHAAERLLAAYAEAAGRGGHATAGALDWTRAMLVGVAARVERGQRFALVDTALSLLHSLPAHALPVKLEEIFLPEAAAPAAQPAAVPATAARPEAAPALTEKAQGYAGAVGLDVGETVMSAARRRGAAKSIRRLLDHDGRPDTPERLASLTRFLGRHCAAAHREAAQRVLADPAFADNQAINLDLGDDRLEMGTLDMLALVWRAAELAPLDLDDKGNVCQAVVAGLIDCWNPQAAADFEAARLSGEWEPGQPRPILVHCDFGRIVRLLEALGGFVPGVNIVMVTPGELCCSQAELFAGKVEALPADADRRLAMHHAWEFAMDRGREELATSWDHDEAQFELYRERFEQWVRMDYAEDLAGP